MVFNLKKIISDGFKFLSVGIVSTLVDWCFFIIGDTIWHFPYWGSLIASYLMGSMVNFGLNKSYTFSNKSRKSAQKIFFFASAGVMFCVSLFLMSILVNYMSNILSRMLTTGITFICNFMLHRNFTFKYWK